MTLIKMTAHSILKRASLAPVLLGSVAGLLLSTAGCEAPPRPDGERPGVIVPSGKPTPADPARSVAADRVLADVDGIRVTDSQVMPVLVEAYGLDVMLKVLQLNMAREVAAQAGLTVSPADVKAERDLTLATALPDQQPEDYDELLDQLLNQWHVTHAEFDILMQTNAYLRALAREPSMQEITEDVIRQEFNALYGERIRVRHIALANMQEVAEAQRRLAGAPATATTPAVPPEPFEQVARQMSRSRATAPFGGAMEPFSRTTAGMSQAFIQTAFSLQPGEVSPNAVQEKEFYHLIKCEELLPPRGQKYEDVRESVREELIRRRQNAIMRERRAAFAQVALRSINIHEPTLKKQFAERVAAAAPRPAERDEVRRSLDEQRARINEETAPTTLPATTAPSEP